MCHASLSREQQEMHAEHHRANCALQTRHVTLLSWGSTGATIECRCIHVSIHLPVNGPRSASRSAMRRICMVYASQYRPCALFCSFSPLPCRIALNPIRSCWPLHADPSQSTALMQFQIRISFSYGKTSLLIRLAEVSQDLLCKFAPTHLKPEKKLFHLSLHATLSQLRWRSDPRDLSVIWVSTSASSCRSDDIVRILHSSSRHWKVNNPSDQNAIDTIRVYVGVCHGTIRLVVESQPRYSVLPNMPIFP
ncbi:hypothetical protein FH972_022486 [Carpinus fangiana]|uniref:Uncharacterized protein n=1 Tax=Carpinus fangiana TaxID=176857 RepID=A0A5N6KSS6_9ROSI|nr:hypothetical protein FH972_022486 [Carpinus fangiana]